MDVKVGDKVLFAKYAGTEIKLDGKKLLILKESDILAHRRVIGWRSQDFLLAEPVSRHTTDLEERQWQSN